MLILTPLRALLGSWLSRIGGWLLLAGGVLTWLWARDRKARGEAVREQEIQGADARRKADDAVARTPDDERTRELQQWER